MTIREVFPRPTVKTVVFQIQFPNLFFIESKIGEFQIAIMERFPESSMLFRSPLILADLSSKDKAEDIQNRIPQDQGQKVWQFNSPLGYKLNVLTDSLAISSNFHKTYNNPSSENRFRDIIEYAINPFLSLTKLPTIGRIGLRYVDECPFAEKTTQSFLEYFTTCFRTDRFSIEDSIEQSYQAVVKRGDCFVRYAERLLLKENTNVLILDFDGFAINIESKKCLQITDQIHELISNEYEQTIKDPVYKYMRNND